MVQLADSIGSIVKTYRYDAFGVEEDLDEEDVNPFRYCGEYFDKEIGTYYLRARYYDPTIGRFTQQDSWEYADSNDPLSLNLYTYSANNPVRYIDASGNDFHDVMLGMTLALDRALQVGRPDGLFTS